MEKSERLQKLEQEREVLNKKIRLEKNRLAKQARKDDTRRKIIAGALALADMDKNPQSPFALRMRELLETYVEKEQERALFSLEPKPAETEKTDV